MNRTVMAAIDFPRQQLRAVIVGAMIALCVATGWQVLARTNMSVVLQFTAMAAYMLAVYRTLHAAKDYQDIIGRGLVAIGTMGLMCAAMVYLHKPVDEGGLMVWAGLGAALLLALGLWLTRPPRVLANQVDARAMAQEMPGFIAFHQEHLAPSMAKVEQIRRKTEQDYWKLSALGVPVAAALGLGLIFMDLAGRPPGWLFLMPALAVLSCGIGAAILSWKPSPSRREEILQALGAHVGLAYHFGGGEDPDHRTATVFGSADHAKRLSLLPPYRELRLGAAFRGSQAGRPFVFGEVTTIPPRKLGQNTARMSRDFLLFIMDIPKAPAKAPNGLTICYEDRGLLGHRHLRPNQSFDGAPETPVEGADLVRKVVLGPNQGNWERKDLRLVNAEFESRFKIYAEDKADARAQLTAPFMAAVMRVRHALPLVEVPRFAFDGGQFLAAIEAPNPWLDLVPPRAMAMDDPVYAEAILARLQMILHIAENLAPDTSE